MQGRYPWGAVLVQFIFGLHVKKKPTGDLVKRQFTVLG